jgi:glycine dehydrogenase subunit 1
MVESGKRVVYPYMPNTVPKTRTEMLDAIGKSSVDELFDAIPEAIRFGDKEMPLPAPLSSEHALRRYVGSILRKNESCDDYISFLGGGVAQHFVPAICDELVRKPEWYTTFLGFYNSDAGKMQLWWEFQSLITDLVEMELCGWPAQDGTTASWGSILLAGRINHDRNEVVLAGNINPERLKGITEVCRAKLDIKLVDVDPKTGLLDMNDLEAKISDKTACVYFENPSYLGGIEDRGDQISQCAHDHGALVVVSVNPISLGLLETPKNYGADIICGELQSLGVHLQYGGGLLGFVATPFDEQWMAEYPYVVISRYRTLNPDEFGHEMCNWATVSYDKREESGDVTSTNSALWAVPVVAYLTVMGPAGLREVGEVIMAKADYARRQLSTVKGVSLPISGSTPFMEFVVNFDETGKSVEEINKALLQHGIFGGHDISKEFPQFGQSALYCVTENLTKSDIDSLVVALREVL